MCTCSEMKTQLLTESLKDSHDPTWPVNKGLTVNIMKSSPGVSVSACNRLNRISGRKNFHRWSTVFLEWCSGQMKPKQNSGWWNEAPREKNIRLWGHFAPGGIECIKGVMKPEEYRGVSECNVLLSVRNTRSEVLGPSAGWPETNIQRLMRTAGTNVFQQWVSCKVIRD